MPSQPSPLSLPQEPALLLFPVPSPYSLISSVLAVFSSLCMEWISRYFHMQIRGWGNGGGNKLAAGSSSASTEAVVLDSVRTRVTIRVTDPSTELRSFWGSRCSSEGCSRSGCIFRTVNWLDFWRIISSLFLGAGHHRLCPAQVLGTPVLR